MVILRKRTSRSGDLKTYIKERGDDKKYMCASGHRGEEVEMIKPGGEAVFSSRLCPLIARAIAGVTIVHAGAPSVAAIPELR